MRNSFAPELPTYTLQLSNRLPRYVRPNMSFFVSLHTHSIGERYLHFYYQFIYVGREPVIVIYYYSLSSAEFHPHLSSFGIKLKVEGKS